MLPFILLIAAFLLFAISAGWAPNVRINLIAAGLACWALSQIFATGLVTIPQ